MNKLVIGASIGIVIVMLAILAMPSDTQRDDGFKIIVSAYPLYEFTTAIVKDKAEVKLLTPEGVEIHDWEPTTRELELLQNADMLIYNSRKLEPYIDKIEIDILLVEASKDIIKNDDPHVWLDPLLAKEQVNNILDVIISIDAKNEEYYKENANTYLQRLDKLHEEFVDGLDNCAKREFIVLHSAYQYLADRYNLKQIPLIELPEEDISAKKVREIIDLIRAKQIDVIYAEEGIDKRVINQLSEEVNVKILTLSPIEVISKEDRVNGITYIDKMLGNLENLRIGLGCV
ncbi:MAG: high-affinity zinc uptake system binding-protein ZnuA [Candidatus Nitrosocaldaceae archaeon]|nr:MAG: high-affinity zinc uptake system binding-protein ZnuA [Candidatus Nitrosocaldaceae archaeon]